MAVNINVPSQVKTYANLAAFPATGALKTIYIAEDTNKTYRWTGSVYVEVSASASGITIGSTAIASGVVGRVLFEGAGNVVQESANLFWDNTNGRLGIGGVTPYYNLIIYNASAPSFALQNSSRVWQHYLSGSNYRFGTSASDMINIAGATGNVGINTNTDAGFRLDVNGTARVKTDLKIETATGGLIIEGDAGGYPTLKINTLRSGTTRRNWMFATEQINGGDFILFRSATAGGVANTLVYSIFNDGNFGLNTSTNAGFRLDVNGTARVQGVLTIGTELYLGNNNTGFFKSTNDFNFYNLANGSVKYRITGASQGFGISDNGYDTVAASAMLQVNSTIKGFLPPRMTTTQKNAIASPATGLQVYDTTLNQMSYYNGTTWTNI